MKRTIRSETTAVSRMRLFFMIAGIILFFIAIIGKLFYIQVIRHAYYQELADGQHKQTTDLTARRGEIYAYDHTNERSRTLYPLAANKTFYEVSIDPSVITRPINTAESLSQVLGVDYETVLKRAEKTNDTYEPVFQKATEEQVTELKKTGLSGINFHESTWRYYPDSDVGSHILGFYGTEGTDRIGKYGIEGYWQKELAGTSEELTVTKDASGKSIPSVDSDFNLAVDGSSLVTTIDRTIQFQVCKILKQGIEKYAAEKGTVIIMETKTGKILSMCNYPSFDPNHYQEVSDIQYFNNDAVFEAYEPGSVFKPISMSIAIDQGKVTPTTVYDDPGEVVIDGHKIRNFDKLAHGVNTMIQVLQQSLNTGAIFATKNVPNQLYYDYVKKFGFGEKTGIEMSQEVAGNLGKLSTAKEIYKATTSFGQGLTVTPLQMLNAINVIANDGILVKPYIIEEVRKSNGEIRRIEPKNVRQVIKKETAHTVAAMMIRVIEEGYDKKASVPGYFLAGKTGTAQVASKGIYGTKTNHTFVGFGPATDSKFSIIIKMYDVKNVGFASDSTTPIFNEIARFLLQYFSIAPNTN